MKTLLRALVAFIFLNIGWAQVAHAELTYLVDQYDSNLVDVYEDGIMIKKYTRMNMWLGGVEVNPEAREPVELDEFEKYYVDYFAK